MISTDYSKSEDIVKDVFKTVNNMIMQVHETQESFIFSTLNKYIMDNYDVVVEKEELARAIQLIRMCKEHGSGICERWTTATQQNAYLNDAYRRGFHDGVTEEHDRIMSILEREVKGNESIFIWKQYY